MKNRKLFALQIALLSVFILASLATAYTYNITSEGWSIADNDYTTESTKLTIFPQICNLLNSVRSYDVSFIGEQEPIRILKKEVFTDNSQMVIHYNGTYNITKLKNGTWVNESYENITSHLRTYEDYEPEPPISKIFSNNRWNGTKSINFGKNECRQLAIQVKTGLKGMFKYAVSALDPLITFESFKIGTSAYPWGDELNTTVTTAKNNTLTNGFYNLTLDENTVTTTSIAAKVVQEDFENNSLTNWQTGGTVITGAGETILNGTYSLNITTGATGVLRPTANVSLNNNNYTVDMAFRVSPSTPVGEWAVRGIVVNNARIVTTNGIRIIQYSDNGACASAGGLICYYSETAAVTSSGLYCNLGNTCNMTLLVNATKGGATTDTVFWLSINGTQAGPFNTVGTTPVAQLTWIGGEISDTARRQTIDDIRIYNNTETTTTTTDYVPNRNYFKSIQIKATAGTGKFLNFTMNITDTNENNGTGIYNNTYNATCNSQAGAGTWTGTINRGNTVKCPIVGSIFIYDIQINGSNATGTSRTNTVQAINISFNMNTLPQPSLTSPIDAAAINRSNVTFRTTVTDNQAHDSNVTLNFSTTTPPQSSTALWNSSNYTASGTAIAFIKNNLKNADTYYWRISANDNWGDDTNSSATRSITVRTVHLINGTEDYAVNPFFIPAQLQIMEKNNTYPITLYKYLGWNSTSDYMENTQTNNVTLLGTPNATTVQLWNASNNLSISTITFNSPEANFTSLNITPNACNLLYVAYNTTQAQGLITSDAINSSCDSGSSGTCYSSINIENLLNSRIDDADVIIRAADLPQWGFRLSTQSTINLKAGTGLGSYQKLNINTAGCSIANATITEETTNTNRTTTGSMTMTANDVTISNFDLGASSTYIVNITYTFNTGQIAQPLGGTGGGGGGGGLTVQVIAPNLTTDIKKIDNYFINLPLLDNKFEYTLTPTTIPKQCVTESPFTCFTTDQGQVIIRYLIAEDKGIKLLKTTEGIVTITDANNQQRVIPITLRIINLEYIFTFVGDILFKAFNKV